MCSMFQHWPFLFLTVIALHFMSYLGADTEKEDGEAYLCGDLAIKCDKRTKEQERIVRTSFQWQTLSLCWQKGE